MGRASLKAVTAVVDDDTGAGFIPLDGAGFAEGLRARCRGRFAGWFHPARWGGLR